MILLAIIYLLMLCAIGCAAVGAYYGGVVLILLAAFLAQVGGFA